ncbi:MAG TPA: lipid II flippase MurJ, partial [Candidatus Limnocylindrales bacterium]|nr:lipid II flippase MurJ [Candidatus Limnocylindrales bacterium]
ALDDPEARQALVLMAPRAVGLGVTQITFIVVTALATGLGAPAVAAFSIAFGLLQLPLGLVSIPLGIVLLPALSEWAAKESDGAFVRALTQVLRLLLFLMVAIAGLLAAVSHQLVAILLPTYDPANAAMVGGTFFVFLGGLPAHAMIAILARAFYARQNTRTPVMLAIMAVVINTTVAATLVGPFGLGGIAAGIALAAWAEVGGLLLLLRRAVPGLVLEGLGRTALHVVTAAGLSFAAAVAVVEVIRRSFGPGAGIIPAIGEVGAAALAYAFVLLLVSQLLRSTEPGEALAFVRAAVRRGTLNTEYGNDDSGAAGGLIG